MVSSVIRVATRTCSKKLPSAKLRADSKLAWDEISRAPPRPADTETKPRNSRHRKKETREIVRIQISIISIVTIAVFGVVVSGKNHSTARTALQSSADYLPKDLKKPNKGLALPARWLLLPQKPRKQKSFQQKKRTHSSSVTGGRAVR